MRHMRQGPSLSVGGVYGASFRERVLSEDAPMRLMDIYSRPKAAAEGRSRICLGRKSNSSSHVRLSPALQPRHEPDREGFFKLKAHLRKIAERTVAALMRTLETSTDTFKPTDCANYFGACDMSHLDLSPL